MSFQGATLADGQLPTAKAALYTATAITIIKSISVVSTTATSQTVELWLKRSGGTSRRICYVGSLDIYESIYLLDEGQSLTLSAGDAIEGATTTVDVVDYLITGAQDG